MKTILACVLTTLLIACSKEETVPVVRFVKEPVKQVVKEEPKPKPEPKLCLLPKYRMGDIKQFALDDSKIQINLV